MALHIFKKELKRNKNQMLFWGIGFILISLLATAIYPLYEKMGMNELMQGMMEKIDPESAEAMGMKDGIFSNVLGTYHTTFSVYVVLMFSIFMGLFGANIIGKEFRFGTTEFLMTRPVTRSTVFTNKISVVLFAFFLMFIIQTGFSALFLELFKSKSEIVWKNFFILQIQSAIVFFVFACFGVFISLIRNPAKNKLGVILGLVFGLFILNTIAGGYEKIEWLSYISPFKLITLEVNDANLEFNWIGSLSLLFVSVLLLVLAKIKFQKMDLIA